MGNVIKLGSVPSSENICMSNGLTSVFVDILSLSGSHMARTVDEKRLITWLSEKDQTKIGIGTIGFDICDMPWNPKTFENDKAFFLKVIEQAKNKSGWNQLTYMPNEELVFSVLSQFKNLVSQLTVNMVNPMMLDEWLMDKDLDDPVHCDFPLCPKHHILLTFWGCLFCNGV